MTDPISTDDAIPPELMAEVMDTVEDQLDRLKTLIHDTHAGQLDPSQALRAFSGVIHSLKGLVRAFGLGGLAALCHRLEDVLAPYQGFDTALLALTGDIVARLTEAMEDGLLADDAQMQALIDHINAAA